VIREVEITELVKKQLRKLPRYIAVKFLGWVTAVRLNGLEEVRKVPGFHDEPVKGTAGRRSIRLSRGYRAYYRIVTRDHDEVTVEMVRVEGVDKHEYGN
jgi:proteic killer suppression protein